MERHGYLESAAALDLVAADTKRCVEVSKQSRVSIFAERMQTAGAGGGEAQRGKPHPMPCVIPFP